MESESSNTQTYIPDFGQAQGPEGAKDYLRRAASNKASTKGVQPTL
jgi:hypothetical protein